MPSSDDRTAGIHHAIGMVAEQLGWPLADAFAQLRVYARASGRSLDRAAADVTSGAVRLGPPRADLGGGRWVSVTHPPRPQSDPRRRPPEHAPWGRCTAYARPRYTSTHVPARRRRSGRGAVAWQRA